MEDVIKVKSHNFSICNIGFFTAIVLITIGIIMITISRNHIVFICGVSCVFPLAIIVFCLSIIFRFYCHTYDVFTQNGVKRIHNGDIVCETTWDNVKSVSYRKSLFWIPLLIFMSAYTLSVESIRVLRIEFINPISYMDSAEHKWESHTFRPDNKNMMFTYISPKNIKRIIPILPSSIDKNLPKSFEEGV